MTVRGCPRLSLSVARAFVHGRDWWPARLQRVQIRRPHAPALLEVVVGEVGVVCGEQQPLATPQRRGLRQRLDLVRVRVGVKVRVRVGVIV